MEKLKGLMAHPRFALHGFYFFLVFLILIFLIFSAVSGPGTKYYWLKIVLKADAKPGEAGAKWSLGGLGACDENKTCTAVAPHGRAVQGCLIWHLAVAVIFLATAMTQAVLVLRPQDRSSLTVSYLTLLLPPAFLLLFMLSALIADFAVRASIGAADDVETVETQGSFWFVIWVIVAEYVMWRERKTRRAEEEEKEVTQNKRAKKEQPEEEVKKGGFMMSWNPWSRN